MNGRILGIDALRGLTMALLAGGASLLQQILTVCSSEGKLTPAVAAQFRHAEWGAGFTCWDMVMPLFIFIVGVSVPFALSSYRQRYGEKWRRCTLLRILRRVVLLFLLGMCVQGHLLNFDAGQLSLFCNTLQAIAVGYLTAALFQMFSSTRTQMIACFLMLSVYGLLLCFMPYDGHEGGRFLPHDNLAYYIDCSLQGSLQDGTPYTWILSSLSFGALTLMGALGGQALRLLTPYRRFPALIISGLICLGAAMAFEPVLPLIKHIFSPTMVLWSGGWCLLLLALFHLLFDFTPRARFLCLPFLAFGSNAIAAYLLTQLPGVGGHPLWWGLSKPLVGGFSTLFGESEALVFSALSFLMLWGLLEILRRHRCLLRI